MKKLTRIALAATAIFATQLASASVVGVFGSNSNTSIVSFLNSNGHTATNYSSSITTANLAGLDVAILLRTNGNSFLDSFVQNGGTLITEWTGADWAVNTLDYFGAAISGGGAVATGTAITVTTNGIALGLNTGLSNPWADGGRTEFFRNFSNIGSADVLATRSNGIAAVIGGSVGSGYAVINGMDWADSFSTQASNSGQFLLNMINIQGHSVPEPSAFLLMALGLLGLGLTHRLKSKS